MNDKWQKGKKRWSTEKMQAVQRLFRGHVRTQSNPRGRIHREECVFCVKLKLDQTTYSEAHHVSYDEPFKIVWVCNGHHRQVDHGSLPVGKYDIWDYSSLVRQKLGLRKARRVTGPSAPAPF